ncbi:bladder cancer-related protein BC10-domain-containing protein [Fusarium oxysporum]|nr:bladder cancer-related protein BC10-domain-containing protein [Fusarium oxysporum]
MFCLRSWLPLLFIPTNASPAFIFLFFICTYFLNRPCVYCSILLLILFLTSCNWSDRLPSEDVAFTSPSGDLAFNSTVLDMANTTVAAIIKSASDDLAVRRAEWSGLGIEWLRNLLGKREWRIDCMDIYIRL